MNQNLSIINFMSVVLVLIVNYFSQALSLGDNTIGGVSKEYRNLFTPHDYAFSIWSLIFFSLLVYCGYQMYSSFISSKQSDFISKTGPWFAIANFANAGWVIVWLYELTGLSVILMFVILFSLIRIVLKTDMERWDAPFKIIAFTWWPICLYAGWITIATISNVASFFVQIGWKGYFFNEKEWTIIMIVFVIIINVLMVYKRNMREFAAVGVWALFAIYVRHLERNAAVAYVAFGGAIILLVYVLYHGYQNRKTNPMYRMITGEKRQTVLD